MMQRISQWPNKYAIVGDVRGRGLMIGVEIVKDQESKTPDAATRDRIVDLAFQRGVLFLGAGPNSVRISPPLIITREEADVAMDVLEDSISVASKQAK
jgi:4-aminobutyrate aminotransferase